MATESEFSRQDFIPDDVLMAPLILTENMEKLLATMDKVNAKSKEFATSAAGAKDSSAATAAASGLSAQQNQLLKIQKQIADTVAKDTQAYRDYEAQLKKLKQTIKDKTVLGDKEALQATKLNSSITELGAALAKNRREYSLLSTEEERQTESARELLSVIQKQDTEFKELREEMGVFVDSVGSYTQSILKADEEIKRLTAENEKLLAVQKKLDTETEAGKKAYDNLNVAIQHNNTQINIYQNQMGKATDETREFTLQGEKAAKNIDALDDLTGNYIMRLKAMGKALIQIASSPFFLTLAAAATLIYAASSALKAFFTTTDEGEDKLEQQSALWNTFFFALKKGWGEVGKTVFDSVEKIGGAKTIVQGLLTYLIAIAPVLTPLLSKIGAIFEETADGAVRITKEMQDLQDKMLVNTLTAAQKELAANKLLEASKNKLVFTDQKRLEFLKQAVDLQESVSTTEIKNQTDLLDLERQDLANKYRGVTVLQTQFDLSEKNLENLGQQIIQSNIVGEEQQKLIGHIKQIIDLQAQYYQQQKRNTSQVSALTLEIEKTEREANQRRVDAGIATARYIFESTEKANAEIVKDEKATSQDRIKALFEVQQSKVNLIQTETKEQLIALERAAQERIRSEGINSQAEIDARLEKDKSYYAQRQIIVDKGEAEIADTIKNSAQGFNFLSEDILSERLRGLDESYVNGNMKVRDYERQRLKIIETSNEEIYTEELDFYSRAIALAKENGADVADLEKQLQDLRTLHAKEGAEKRKKIEEDERAARIQLMNSIFDTAIQIDSNLTQKKQNALDTQLNNLKANYDLQIKLAGDDSKMKEKLAVEFAAREKEIQDEKKRLQRKQAIFEKTLAISQATINTYLAATEHLAVPFLFAATLALGALQIATIASTPIPEAEFGIKDHKGGLLRVSEAGPELAIYPGGKLALTPSKESIINAPKGTEIIPHDKTMRMLALAALSVPDSVTVDYQIQKQFEQLKDQLVLLVNNGGGKTFNGSLVFQQGVNAYRLMRTREGHETIVMEHVMGIKR